MLTGAWEQGHGAGVTVGGRNMERVLVCVVGWVRGVVRCWSGAECQDEVAGEVPDGFCHFVAEGNRGTWRGTNRLPYIKGNALLAAEAARQDAGAGQVPGRSMGRWGY